MSGTKDTLNGVAAISTKLVATVGNYGDTNRSIPVAKTLVAQWNGLSWALQSTPDVGASDNLLQGVTAVPGSSTVFAVGFHLQAAGPYQTLILKGP